MTIIIERHPRTDPRVSHRLHTPKIENDLTRRGFLVGSAAALLLAGCESGEQSSGETRTVKHAMGESEVPVDPKRVIVLDTGELDSVITLGVKPVGAAETIPGEGFPSYLEDETEGIEKVGTITEPNLEKIATLEPDLILSSKIRLEQVYDQLSQLAPTIFTETTGVTWRENFRKHAEALNKEAEAEAVVNGYEARIEEFRQAMGDRLDDTEVSVVRFTPGDTRIYQKESFIGTVLDDAGLPRPESQDVEEFALMNVSAEYIPKMGGDAIFVTVYGTQEDTAREGITSDPLWRQLEAVQEGRVYEVSDDLWMLGIGHTAAQRIFDTLQGRLVEEE